MNNLSIENLANMLQIGDPARVSGESTRGGTATSGQAGSSFADILKNSFEQVNEQQQQADQAIRELVAGRNKNIHETMLAIERADSSLKLMMQVRNKVLDAYREIMRMQV
jgi:flagellar hook-basal body complex protein FliE